MSVFLRLRFYLMRVAVIVSHPQEFLHTNQMANNNLNLLIVEDDQILATSLKMMAPDGFKVYLVQKIELIPVIGKNLPVMHLLLNPYPLLPSLASCFILSPTTCLNINMPGNTAAVL